MTVFHIQDVNNHHQLLKDWLKRYHGVATKYLPTILAGSDGSIVMNKKQNNLLILLIISL
tara:strand:+ start:10092 stop:10271 length:180 start_codon:yes stop_codon:yes gene_type:complete